MSEHYKCTYLGCQFKTYNSDTIKAHIQAHFDGVRISKEQAELVHLTNWLYKEARMMTEEIRVEQILKGAAKYPIPLGDAEWTPEQLVHHAMQENIDQNHYLVMLLHEIKKLQKELDFYKEYYNMEMKKPLD
jgi:hypothetical protein